MKQNQRELLNLFGASAIATVFYEITSNHIPRQIVHLVLGSYGRIESWIIIGLFTLTLFLLAEIAAYFWLKPLGFRGGFIATFLGACVGTGLWLALGIVAHNFSPIDQTFALYIAFLGGQLVSWFIIRRSIRPVIGSQS